MNHNDPLDFGPYRAQNLNEFIFLFWADNLVIGINLVTDRNEGTNENYAKVHRCSTICAYLVYKELHEEEVEVDIRAFYFDFLLPSLNNFLKNNDELIVQATTDSSHALSFFEDLIHKQTENVDDEQLQEQWEALLADGDLLHASQEFRDHIERIVHKHRISKHIPTHFDIENLIDDLHQRAIKDAQDNTGPARRKKRGRNAGRPKKLEDAFSWSSVTERLKDIINPDRSGKKPPVSDEDKQQFISWAEEYCTPLQAQYVRMVLAEGLTFGQIAAILEKAPSTVHEGYEAAKKRIYSKISLPTD